MTPVRLCHDRLAGWRLGEGRQRVLALHGWLDNANSFLALAERLAGFELVALDFPGHGQSEPRAPDCRYHFDDYVFDVKAAVEALGWDRFAIIGHSLGGAVASLFAATRPGSVTALALIEGLGPLSAAPDRTLTGWRQAIERSRPRDRRFHPDLASAIAARRRNSDLSEGAAAQLAERGVSRADEGFYWSHDPRLTWPSTQRYTEPQVLDLLAGIEAPVLSIVSEPPGRLVSGPVWQRRLAALGRVRQISAPGGHHLHMHSPADIAPSIEHFLKEAPS